MLTKAPDRLLELDGTAGGFDLGFHFFGFRLVYAFLKRLGCAFDEAFGFSEAQASDGADFLDDLDFLATVAGENDVEFVQEFFNESWSFDFFP